MDASQAITSILWDRGAWTNNNKEMNELPGAGIRPRNR